MTPLRVITPQGESATLQSPKDFETAFQVRYAPHLECTDPHARLTLEKCHQKALERGWITPRQKWLGQYYAERMHEGPPPDLTIAWIDATVGYGVFTDRPLPAGSFVGEYTGLLRKRRFWGRWDNLYCFDYTVGERKSTSLVIDSQDLGNHTRFLNHSSHPNLALASVYFQSTIRVILYAKAAIPSGTQLCYDYGTAYWAKRSKPREWSSTNFR